MKEENVWAWLMPSGKIYRVLTNPEDGTVKVYDPSGKLTRKDENLAEEAVTAIEKNFLDVVATKVKGKEMIKVPEKDITNDIALYIR
jgi:hypothetical protein